MRRKVSSESLEEAFWRSEPWEFKGREKARRRSMAWLVLVVWATVFVTFFVTSLGPVAVGAALTTPPEVVDDSVDGDDVPDMEAALGGLSEADADAEDAPEESGPESGPESGSESGGGVDRKSRYRESPWLKEMIYGRQKERKLKKEKTMDFERLQRAFGTRKAKADGFDADRWEQENDRSFCGDRVAFTCPRHVSNWTVRCSACQGSGFPRVATRRESDAPGSSFRRRTSAARGQNGGSSRGRTVWTPRPSGRRSRR